MCRGPVGTARVLFGTELHEPTLWRYIESRNQKGGRHARELRPGSYFITPVLSKARQVLLEELNVDWIPMCAEEFATSWLNRLRRAAETGFDAISASRTAEERSTVPSLVSDLSTAKVRRDSDYCSVNSPLGPTCRAGERSFEKVTNGFTRSRETHSNRLRSQLPFYCAELRVQARVHPSCG